MRLVYLMSDYPLVTTTFVDREVKRLREMGANIDILASRRPGAGVPLSDDQRRIRDTVTYLRPAPFIKLLLSHAYFLMRSPLRLASSYTWFLHPAPSRDTYPTLDDSPRRKRRLRLLAAPQSRFR